MELASQLTAREAIEFFLIWYRTLEYFDDDYQNVKEADEEPHYINVRFTLGENGSIIGYGIWNNEN